MRPECEKLDEKCCHVVPADVYGALLAGLPDFLPTAPLLRGFGVVCQEWHSHAVATHAVRLRAWKLRLAGYGCSVHLNNYYQSDKASLKFDAHGEFCEFDYVGTGYRGGYLRQMYLERMHWDVHVTCTGDHRLFLQGADGTEVKLKIPENQGYGAWWQGTYDDFSTGTCSENEAEGQNEGACQAVKSGCGSHMLNLILCCTEACHPRLNLERELTTVPNMCKLDGSHLDETYAVKVVDWCARCSQQETDENSVAHDHNFRVNVDPEIIDVQSWGSVGSRIATVLQSSVRRETQ